MRRLAVLAVMAVALPAPGFAHERWYEPPLSLPQGLRHTVQVPVDRKTGSGKPADTIRDLFPLLTACWRAPEGLEKFERTEITVRFSLRRDGSVIGTPQITFSKAPADDRGKALLTDAAVSAIRHCTPVRITPALGGAIAGRPLSIRFIYEGPKGKGV
ncbi:hypothetical protein [Methylobacterium gnaphalii]|uniref:TonB C-terminal domain-containing protein n=1 Tax=Methylobacterium gnaphalii TaxID=1010610 RepID=A0A512JJI3_9HYPH|nr:hypothetical protein [Methylobacterium gnaphalii]GEP10110.1 hypothetical protein MGN01_19550 [Methylobacterium gnaphalii]GJD70841.1 hypothetical protein MMMDOFMJ_3794 [Methylobacterium gnaphalii]GLS48380.1 hypothetical protein GCM10007885_12240 [Methylobacterium gnaphalii]